MVTLSTLTRREFVKVSLGTLGALVIPINGSARPKQSLDPHSSLGYLVTAESILWKDVPDFIRNRRMHGVPRSEPSDFDPKDHPYRPWKQEYAGTGVHELDTSYQLETINGISTRADGGGAYPHKAIDSPLLVFERRFFSPDCEPSRSSISHTTREWYILSNYLRFFGHFTIYPVQSGSNRITLDSGESSCLYVTPGDVVLLFAREHNDPDHEPFFGIRKGPLAGQPEFGYQVPCPVNYAHSSEITDKIYALNAQWWGRVAETHNPLLSEPLSSVWPAKQKQGIYEVSLFSEASSALDILRKEILRQISADSNFLNRSSSLSDGSCPVDVNR